MKRILWLVIVLTLMLSPLSARSKIGDLPTPGLRQTRPTHAASVA